jgi:hypothetical protein
MGFKDLMGKAQELKDAAADTASGYLDEFNEALPTIRALGFSVRNVSVGMGLIPEVGATLIAAVDDVKVEQLNELIEANKEKKTLVAVLKALQAAYNIKQQFRDIPFRGVQIDMKLGLPPHIGVQFVSATPVAEAAALLSQALT